MELCVQRERESKREKESKRESKSERDRERELAIEGLGGNG